MLSIIIAIGVMQYLCNKLTIINIYMMQCKIDHTLLVNMTAVALQKNVLTLFGIIKSCQIQWSIIVNYRHLHKNLRPG